VQSRHNRHSVADGAPSHIYISATVACRKTR